MLATMKWHFFAAVCAGGKQGEFFGRDPFGFSMQDQRDLLAAGAEKRVTDWIERTIFRPARRLLFLRFRHTPRAA
jgi:hypothetical protein